MSQLLHGLLNLALQAPDAAAEVANAATKAAAETVEAATEIVPAAQASGTSPFVFTLLTLFILVLPFVLAYVVAKALKVQEWTGRIAVIFFLLAVGASPFLTSLMKGEPLNKRFRLGIDLAGGTNKQAQKVARVLRTVRPQIVLLNEFDFSEDNKAVNCFREEYLNATADWANEQPISYPYFFTAPVNTGVPSGQDLDHDGKTDGPGDAIGFGRFGEQGCYFEDRR